MTAFRLHGETEVTQFNDQVIRSVALLRVFEEDVFCFDVTVDNVQWVQVVYGTQYLVNYFGGFLLVQRLFLSQHVTSQVATLTVLHHHVLLLLILENVE